MASFDSGLSSSSTPRYRRRPNNDMCGPPLLVPVRGLRVWRKTQFLENRGFADEDVMAAKALWHHDQQDLESVGRVSTPR